MNVPLGHFRQKRVGRPTESPSNDKLRPALGAPGRRDRPGVFGRPSAGLQAAAHRLRLDRRRFRRPGHEHFPSGRLPRWRAAIAVLPGRFNNLTSRRNCSIDLRYARRSITAPTHVSRLARGSSVLKSSAAPWRTVWTAAGGYGASRLAATTRRRSRNPSVNFASRRQGSSLCWQRMARCGGPRATGPNGTLLDHEVADFQPIGDVVYIVGTDKRLWRLHADGKSRDPVDEKVAAFQAIGSTWCPFSERTSATARDRRFS